jgi:predicted NBD/HSP70 family sugar kinase
MPRDGIFIKTLQVIQRYGSIDKSTIAEKLNISMMTVNKVMNDLIQRSIIKKSGKYEGKPGRKSDLFGLNPDLFIAIGMSIDEENIIISAVKPDGSMISHSKYSGGIREWFRNAESIVEVIVEHYKLFMKKSGLNPEKIAVAGVAPHGIIDTRNGRCIMGTHLGGIVDLNLRDALARVFNLPVFVDDPARSLTYYEKKYGAGRDVNNFIYVFIDLGVGSGVVINGDIYLGASGMSGEIGHIIVDDNGVRCKCGNYGCLETVASIENIIRQFREGIEAGVLTRIVDLCNGDIERLDLDVIKDAAEGEDKFTHSVLESVGNKLGRALSVIITLFNPELILIGGRVAVLTPYLLESIQREIKYRALNPMNKQVPIRTAEYSEIKNCVSVALEAIDALFQDEDFLRSMRNTCFQHICRG